ncbi:MAG: hypothetical protein ACI9FN_001404 [Saprospiraceae bacterium]|jgi:hypothetical protein
MKLIITFILHILSNMLVGISILHVFNLRDLSTIRVIQAFVIGILIETTLGFFFLMIAMDCIYSFYLITILALIYLTLRVFMAKNSFQFSKAKLKFKGIELLLISVIQIKVLLSFISWIRLPLYFDDAMTHWSGRARALYGKVNWSMDPENVNFLGDQFGYTEYPFLSVIWRVNGATLNGSWHEIISRSDSYIFYLILLYSVYYLVQKLTEIRWVSLSAVILTTALPLEFLHATSGYCEIVLQALIILFLIALIQREWIIAGFISSACIFTKNEGLILLMPLFYLMTIWNIWHHRNAKDSILKSIVFYSFSSFLLVLPWLLFKLINHVPFSTPTKSEYYYHDDSFTQFVTAMFASSSASVFWIMIFFLLIINIRTILSHHILRMILFLMLSLITAFFLIFCFTGANMFLINQMTIHRSLLQIAPIGIILIAISSSYNLSAINNSK